MLLQQLVISALQQPRLLPGEGLRFNVNAPPKTEAARVRAIHLSISSSQKELELGHCDCVGLQQRPLLARSSYEHGGGLAGQRTRARNIHINNPDCDGL